MATNRFKKLPQGGAEKTDLHRHNWNVMLPFIKFGVGAMKLIAHTLLYIVKHIPKPGHNEPKPGGRVIKIK